MNEDSTKQNRAGIGQCMQVSCRYWPLTVGTNLRRTSPTSIFKANEPHLLVFGWRPTQSYDTHSYCTRSK